MHVKFCPKKGCDYASSCNVFCVRHGLKLMEGDLGPETNYPCPKCGAMRFEEDNFCGTCGAGRCFVFVFRPLVGYCGFFVVADREEVAWCVLIKETNIEPDYAELEFTLAAKLEVPL